MNKYLLSLLAALLFAFSIVGDCQAIPFSLNENGTGLLPDNSWADGERYTFSGGSIDVAPGHYELNFRIQGKVWAEGTALHGWEPKDKIIIEAYLGESLMGSTIGRGLDGQQRPFDLSLSLDFNFATENVFQIHVYSDVSHWTEHWRLNNAALNGTYTLAGNTDRGDPVATPEPATMVLLGSGLLGLTVVKRRFTGKS